MENHQEYLDACLMSASDALRNYRRALPYAQPKVLSDWIVCANFWINRYNLLKGQYCESS